ncbi:lysylphosphatidylglycerol synthase transmembrane domain-containing protein [Geodermatophilus sp. CPCC 205761]|uniref:lysylphosphatidylglycerol synthase transmembrane domain-containing protein n=1 Tax=Geodermatophilus sp. CPCC 205761 TaxID=2936597 RepID=UPI003EEA0C1B
MRRRAWTATRLLGVAVLLAVLLRKLGADPFLDGLRGLDPGTLLAATAIGAVTTVCSAWRWRVVARALGLDLALPAATAAYYRSQFLNCTLPGGVLGDVHRGVRHGVGAGDLGLGVRAVVWERAAGQAVQVVLALLVLLALPSPVQGAVPLVALAGAAAGAAVLVTGRGVAGRSARLGRALRGTAAEIRRAVLQPSTWPAVLLASLLVVGGLLGTFLLAARAAGVHAPPLQLLPLALIVLLAAAVPLNVAGWGPREGVAAWVFAAAGWGAGPGTAVATAFGVMTLVATLPGAAVLLVGWLRVRWRGARSARVLAEHGTGAVG